MRCNGLVAQWIERLSPEQKVVGSNPIKPTRHAHVTCAYLLSVRIFLGLFLSFLLLSLPSSSLFPLVLVFLVLFNVDFWHGLIV